MTLRPVLLGAVAVLLAGGILAGCVGPRSDSSAGSGKQAERERFAREADAETQINALAHFATGLSHDLNDQPDQALDEMIRAAQADPSYEPIVIEAARRCLRGNQAEQAVQLLSKATSYPEASGVLYSWLGLAYAQIGKADLAVIANRTAIRKSPESLTAYQNLAQLYLQTSRTNEALAVLDEATRQSVTDPGFLIELGELYLRYSRTQGNQGQSLNERIVKILDRAAKLGPTNPLQLLRLADAYFGLGELKKAEPYYRELIEEHPDLPSLRGKLTEIYLRSGQKEKASQQLEALARNEPTNPQTYLVLGALAVEDEKYAEAAEHFERALTLNPDLEQVYYDLAGLKLSLDKPEEALAVLEKARARFKLSYWMEFYTGLAYRDAEKYSDALNSLTSAEAIAKATDPARLNHLFYFQMGSTHERAGHFDEAETYFREALNLEPEDPETLNYLGYMWAEQGVKLEEARKLIEQAVKIQPESSAFLDSLAWVLFKLNKPREALPPMLKAIENSKKPDATLFDHLGDIYAALQQHDKARAAWADALKVKPNEQIQRKFDASPAISPSAP